MFAAKPMIAAVVAASLGYIAYPYITLYRIDHAVHTGDAATLQALVDWPSVREGIKEDICDNVADSPSQAIAHGELPAFGASFVQGIATNAVDQRVTPEGLVDMTRQDAASASAHGKSLQVDWAFFDAPTDFLVSLDVPGQPGTVRLRMTLQDARWRVTRIWLTPHLLREANART